MNIMVMDNNLNKVVGHSPTFVKSTLNFKGKNNVLFCAEKVRLENSILNFCGNNSLIFLGTGVHKLVIDLYNDSVFHSGCGNEYTATMKVLISEHEHCFIGDDSIISFGVIVRNSDPHLIYSCDDSKRINMSQSVYIGDHVWLGQNVSILKDTNIDSGSIIGASSVVAGKRIPYNTIWAGNPARMIRENIFWDKVSVHNFTDEDTMKSMDYREFVSKKNVENDCWIFEHEDNQAISWDYMELMFNSGTAMDKCAFLTEICVNKVKNRFAHKR